jgi:hypothetical protein
LFSKTASNLNGINGSVGSGTGTITFNRNIASFSGLKMVSTGTNAQYANAVVTGAISGGVLTVSYTDSVKQSEIVDIVGVVTDATGNQYSFRQGPLGIN